MGKAILEGNNVTNWKIRNLLSKNTDSNIAFTCKKKKNGESIPVFMDENKRFVWEYKNW